MEITIFFVVILQQVSARNNSRTTALRFGQDGFIFPQLDMSPLTEALTICTWLNRLTERGSISQYWLSYVTQANWNEILISSTAHCWLFSDFISPKLESLLPKRGTNEWHHFCVTWGNSTRKKCMYYDGKKIGAKPTGERKLHVPGSLMFGQLHKSHGLSGWSIDSCCPFQGELYDTNIFSTQLSADQVKEMFSQGLCSNYSLSFENDTLLSWEYILQMKRRGNVTARELGECEKEEYVGTTLPTPEEATEKYAEPDEETTKKPVKNNTHARGIFWPFLAIVGTLNFLK